MYLTDIAPHDMSADWVVMAEAKAQVREGGSRGKGSWEGGG
jgi:hypothetical protein